MAGAHQKTVARVAPARAPQPLAAVSARAGQVIQTASLRVSSPKDPAEREAESTARRVMRMSAPGPADERTTRFSEARAALHRARGDVANASQGDVATVPAALRHEIEGASGGAPLSSAVRRFMEPRFRADFSAVRVHTSERAATLSRQLNARAFTVGPQIFFAKGQFQPDSAEGRELLAHELTHTLQQGAAARRSADDTVAHTVAPHVQRGLFDLDFSGVLNFFADAANAIPGFRLFTLVIGVNPISRAPVDRSAANLLRAFVEFMPGGGLITRALDAYGVFDRVGAWIERQLNALGISASSIRAAVDAFLKGLGAADILSPGSVWARAKRIFAEPAERILRFAGGLASEVLRIIKEAILRPLADLAAKTRGWDLLCAVLGRNPITGDTVARTPEALIGGFMKFIGQEEVWQNVQKARAIPRAWAWCQGALDGLVGFVRELPGLFVAALARLEVADIVALPTAFARVASVFAGFAQRFVSWAGETVWTLLELVFDVVAPGLLTYLKRAASAFRTILENPIRFVGNLIRAGVRGLRQFAENFLTHLRASLIGWLTGAMSGANVYVPQSLTLREIIKFVLSVLGLTWDNIRQKLVKAVGPTAVTAMEKGFDLVVTLVQEGPAAAWEKIKESLSNLREMVMEQIMSFVAERVVSAAITKLLMMLDPSGIGAVVQAVIAIYNTVMFFVERMRQIAQVAAAFIDSIAAIASGNLTAAAARVESTLAGLLTLVISFLARLAGLGRVTDAVTRVIDKVRQPIDKALDRVIDWIVKTAQKLGRFIAQAGVPQDPKERVRLAAEASVKAARALSGRVTKGMLDPVLAAIKLRYGLTELRPYEKGGTWWVRVHINPEADSNLGVPSTSVGTKENPIDIEWVKPPVENYPKIDLNIQGVPKKVGPLDSTEVGDITIGVTNPVARGIRPGFVFQAAAKVSGDSVKDRMNRVLNANGYDRAKGDGAPRDNDHVWEKQLGGPDDHANLWPLNQSVNRSSGGVMRGEIARIKAAFSLNSLEGIYLRIKG